MDDGWVEQDGEEISASTIEVCSNAIAAAGLGAEDILAIGITNQRETTLLWDADSGDLLHRAIVWQDRRTADYCAQLKSAGYETTIVDKTGLLLDPYFSATKLHWLLQNVPGATSARSKASSASERSTVSCFGV